jgi:hypothetical protein
LRKTNPPIRVGNKPSEELFPEKLAPLNGAADDEIVTRRMGEPNARRWQQNKRKMEASDGGQEVSWSPLGG